MSLPVRHAVAMVIRRDDGAFLSVKRPPSDRYLANAWGLPAGNVGEGETPEQAVIRAAWQKLGIAITVTRCLGAETVRRPAYDLHLTEYEVEVVSGEPRVPQSDHTITQYVSARFTQDVDTLIEAARRGSACCRLFLRDVRRSWEVLSPTS